MTDTALSRHPLSTDWPDLPPAEYAALVHSISAHGVRLPIAIYQGMVLDGWHRYKACHELGIADECPRTDVSFVAHANPVDYVIAANGHRRHLTPGQWAGIYAEIETIGTGRKKGHDCGFTVEDLARFGYASERSIQAARAVLAQAPVLLPHIKDGTIAPNDALNLIGEPPDLREEAIYRVKRRYPNEKAGQRGARPFTAGQAVRDIRTEQLKDDVRRVQPTTCYYSTLVIDPPWPEQSVPYPTMTLDQIEKLGPERLPAVTSAALWLWATQNTLPFALGLVDRWGFNLQCILTWCKPGGRQPTGHPQLSSEFVILALREMVMLPLTTTWFKAPRGAHSEKPEEFYQLVRAVSPTPRLDMFGRRSIEGFDSWGAEAPSTEETQEQSA